MHLTSGVPGAAVPPDVTKLRYGVVVCELDEGCAGGLHALVGSLFVKNKGFFDGN